MFKTAVVGPVAARGFGVAHECIECGGAQTPTGGQACTGFGPGCLGLRRKDSKASARPDDKNARLTFKNERSR
jgi:hypothetical protein